MKIRHRHPVHIPIPRHITGENNVAAIRAEAGVDVSLLDVHTAAVLTERFGAVKAVAVPLPEAHHLAAIADDQVEIIGVDVAGRVGEGVLLPFGVVIAHFAEEFVAVGFLAVIADVDAVGVPIFVTDPLFRLFTGADPPGATGVHVQPPDPVIDQVPGAFVAEGEQVRLRR